MANQRILCIVKCIKNSYKEEENGNLVSEHAHTDSKRNIKWFSSS